MFNCFCKDTKRNAGPKVHSLGETSSQRRQESQACNKVASKSRTTQGKKLIAVGVPILLRVMR